MKKFLPLYCALLICFISCENDIVEGCQDRPLEELEWLQREIQSMEAQSSFASFLYVQQAEYLGLPVFMMGNCCPSCLSVLLIYTCEGENLCDLGDCGKIRDQLKNRRLIWQGPDFKCNL